MVFTTAPHQACSSPIYMRGSQGTERQVLPPGMQPTPSGSRCSASNCLLPRFCSTHRPWRTRRRREASERLARALGLDAGIRWHHPGFSARLRRGRRASPRKRSSGGSRRAARLPDRRSSRQRQQNQAVLEVVMTKEHREGGIKGQRLRDRRCISRTRMGLGRALEHRK